MEKVLASGKTPAGTHRPIMVSEVMDCLRPSPGELAVDCTLGGGGHARAILGRVQPAGRLIGLDVDPIELPRTEAALRAEGFGPETFTAHRLNFAGLPKVLATEALADMIFADLGVSRCSWIIRIAASITGNRDRSTCGSIRRVVDPRPS